MWLCSAESKLKSVLLVLVLVCHKPASVHLFTCVIHTMGHKHQLHTGRRMNANRETTGDKIKQTFNQSRKQMWTLHHSEWISGWACSSHMWRSVPRARDNTMNFRRNDNDNRNICHKFMCAVGDNGSTNNNDKTNEIYWFFISRHLASAFFMMHSISHLELGAGDFTSSQPCISVWFSLW